MELKAKVGYAGFYGILQPGDTTEGKGYPQERKQQMLVDFPDWFEVIQEDKPAPVTEEGVKKPRGK